MAASDAPLKVDGLSSARPRAGRAGFLQARTPDRGADRRQRRGQELAARAVLGINRPETGSIAFKGREIAGMAADRVVRAGISPAPEGRGVFAAMSVLDNLLLGAPSRRLSSTLIAANTPRPSGTSEMPPRTTRSAARPAISRPLKAIEPFSGRLMPSTVSSSELLPAPLAPISTTISPVPHLEGDPTQGLHVAVGHRQAVDLQQHVTRSQGRPPAPGDPSGSRGHALGDLLAEVQHGHRVREVHEHLHVVADHHHGHPSLAHLPDDLLDALHLLHAHARSRLVEQQDLRVADEGPRDLHELTLGPHEVRRPPVGHGVDAREGERVMRALLDVPLAPGRSRTAGGGTCRPRLFRPRR